MPIPCYLAMTAAEFARCKKLPAHMAWMACHFSPYGTGLENLPRDLPEGSVLMVNDRIPICGHNPALVREQLEQVLGSHGCAGLVMDLQRGGEETEAMVDALRRLEHPVVIPQHLATREDMVLLPPIPPDEDPAEYLKPWQGRQVWLELSFWGQMIDVTEKGCAMRSQPDCAGEESFRDPHLCCHYRLELGESARFFLWRTREDQQRLLEAAEKLGVTAAIGLYQELEESKTGSSQ